MLVWFILACADKLEATLDSEGGCQDARGRPAEATIWYEDQDEDGHGSAELPVESCVMPVGAVANGDDCDDTSASVHPGADEQCNATDDDCDGTVDEDALDAPTWFEDVDQDGHGDPARPTRGCSAPAGAVARGDDCDDASASVFPGAPEVCDGADDDCDGTADEDAVDAPTWHPDADADGHGDPTRSIQSCETPEGAVEPGDDCDDTSAAVFPGAPEVCNFRDDDCDGTADEDAVDALMWFGDADGDGYGDPSVLLPSCHAPVGYVSTGADCDDGAAAVHPGAPELCDSLDDDCDGALDEDAADASRWYADADGDGYGDPEVVVAACAEPAGYTSVSRDCDDTAPGVNPGASEVCDGLDNDCNHTVDNHAVDALVWYLDADADGFGNPDERFASCEAPDGYVSNPDDCDDRDPARAETCLPCETLYVYPGDVRFSGRTATGSMETFCRTYNAVEGGVTVWESDVVDLADLGCLCEVGGDLSIGENEDLESLRGLGNLTYIGGDLYTRRNPLVTSYGGLDSLATIGGSVYPSEPGSGQLNFSGLEGVSQVGGVQLVSTGFTSLDGLVNAADMPEGVYAADNPRLVSIDGLRGLTTVGRLVIDDNAITDLDALSSLRTITDYAYLSVDTAMSVDGLAALETVTGRFALNGPFTDLRGLTGLRSVGYLELDSFEGTTMEGLESLEAITERLVLRRNALLTSLHGLEHVTTLGGIDLDENLLLPDLKGLESVTEISGNIGIDTVMPGFKFSGLEGLGRLGGSLRYSPRASGTEDFSGLEGLTRLEGTLGVYGTGSFNGLGGLVYLGGISGSTRSMEGLTHLERVDGDVWVNNSTDDMRGLERIRVITGDLSGEYWEGLESEGLDSLEEVGGDLYWPQCHPDGFVSLRTVGGDVWLDGDFDDGLDALTSVGGSVYIANTEHDASGVGALGALESIGGDLVLGDESGGIDADGGQLGLPALRSLGGTLSLVHAGGAGLGGFSSLTGPIGGLTIVDSAELASLGGLEGITGVDGDVEIAGTNAPDFVPLYNIEYILGALSLHDNAEISPEEAAALLDVIGPDDVHGAVRIDE